MVRKSWMRTILPFIKSSFSLLSAARTFFAYGPPFILGGVSKEMLSNYDKGMHHINAWDSVYFVTLLASCGFEMIDYLPTEGVAIPIF